MEKGERMNQVALNAYVSDLHRMEEAFQDTFSENMELFAANILNQRMFIYNIEKTLMERLKSGPENHMATLYNYLNDYVDKKESPYRNLVLFEIDQLLESKNCSPDEVEKYFILENCSMNVNLFMHIYHKENGIKINPYDLNVVAVEDILLNLGISRKMALKFCVAGIAECFERGSPEVVSSIVGDKADKFYKFYDTAVANHNTYDGDGFMLLLFLATFTYICESF